MDSFFGRISTPPDTSDIRKPSMNIAKIRINFQLVSIFQFEKLLAEKNGFLLVNSAPFGLIPILRPYLELLVFGIQDTFFIIPLHFFGPIFSALVANPKIIAFQKVA